MEKKKELKLEFKIDLLEIAYEAPVEIRSELEKMSVDEVKTYGEPYQKRTNENIGIPTPVLDKNYIENRISKIVSKFKQTVASDTQIINEENSDTEIIDEDEENSNIGIDIESIKGPNTELKLVKIKSKSYYNEFVINIADFDLKTKKKVFHKYGYLRFGSPNPLRPHIYIRVHNKVFSDPYLLGCRFRVEELLGLTFEKITKLDIACDINQNLVKRFYYYLRQPSLTFILFNRAYRGDEEGLNETVTELTTFNKGSRLNPLKNKGFTLNGAKNHQTKNKKIEDDKKDQHSRSTNDGLKARCYDKRVEIDEHSGKDYIREKSCISEDEDMFRLETSITSHKHITETLDLINKEITHYNQTVLGGVAPLGTKDPLKEKDIYILLSDDGFIKKWFQVTMDRICRIRLHRKVCFSLLDLLVTNQIKFKANLNKYISLRTKQ